MLLRRSGPSNRIFENIIDWRRRKRRRRRRRRKRRRKRRRRRRRRRGCISILVASRWLRFTV
jgi:hypothetical protein